jgi:deoxyribose-phosphate aldolase
MPDKIGQFIDHTLLRPTATADDLARLCKEACEHEFRAVCVFPAHVSQAREMLSKTAVSIATVIAFPFGVTFKEVKAAEMAASAEQGAAEADFVLDISSIKSGNDAFVEAEMQYLTDLARQLGVVSKVIIETGCLSDDEKVRLCRIANRVGPDYLKTSTGYGPSGATVTDVQLMRATLRSEIHIKASGGIRTYADAVSMLEAGASRIGTSSGVAIVEESERL